MQVSFKMEATIQANVRQALLGRCWALGEVRVPVVLPGVANMAGNPPGARQGRDETWRRGAGWGSVRSGGRLGQWAHNKPWFGTCPS